MCSSGHDVPSKATIFETLIFPGLGVAINSAANGEFINIGASFGPPRLNSSREIMTGLAGWLDPGSRVNFRSSRFLSTNN